MLLTYPYKVEPQIKKNFLPEESELIVVLLSQKVSLLFE